MANIYIYTGNQVLQSGLEMVGFPLERQQRQKRASNIDDFEAHYGVHPVVIAQIWEDLQRTPIAAARLCASPPWASNGMVTMKNLLHSFHFLKRYQTESERKGTTGYSKPTLRTWCWFFVKRIQALKAAKVSLLYAIVQVIFSFCRAFSQNFLHRSPGLLIKSGERRILFARSMACAASFTKRNILRLQKIHLCLTTKAMARACRTNLLFTCGSPADVWMAHNPVTKDNDRKCFIQPGGLRSRIPTGKKAIADNGYRGKGGDPKVATPNSHDPDLLREFKARARMRQESFNSRIKSFDCLNTARFLHSRDRHVQCFEAVCVICCYEMEMVSPVFAL